MRGMKGVRFLKCIDPLDSVYVSHLAHSCMNIYVYIHVHTYLIQASVFCPPIFIEHDPQIPAGKTCMYTICNVKQCRDSSVTNKMQYMRKEATMQL